MKKYVILFSLFVIASLVLVFTLVEKNDSKINRFKNYQELENFIKSNSRPSYGFIPMMRENAMASVSKADYSQTNIQVQGVDEADIVKTDGEYIYSVNGQDIFIVKAYPAEDAKVVSKIQMKDYPQQIFLQGDKIVVFGQKSYDYYFMPDYYYNSKTFVKIYDISEKDNPKLIKDILITGNYFQSRMIDDYVYVIISEPVYYNPPRPIPLPVITTDKTTKTISANEIYYFGYPDYSYSYTTVMSINLQSLNYETKTFLIGVSQNLYVSKENIYLAYTKYIDQYEINQRFFENVVIPNLPQNVIQKINEIKSGNFEQHQEFYQIMNVIDEYISSLDEDQRSEFMKRIEKESSEFFAELSKESEKTIINKLSINGHNIDFVANAEVPGHVLNQFSMDEYDGNFRIATTVSGFNSESFNNIYVLDNNMNIIGKIEDLAEGERIYSVRFLNEKAYVVTFKQIDPFFVIDLSDPRQPNLLGYLKLPGVSDYLHPYDENYIIGFGRDIDEDGRVKGLKVSMFDVSDFNNPKEVSKYVVQGNFVYSEALYEHKAFLFSKEKNLMVVPASISRGSFYTWETWNGLLVFNVNTEKIDLKGRIEQDQGFSQIRSLYIDDVLYSVSTSYITANRIDDLSEINKIKLFDAVYVSR